MRKRKMLQFTPATLMEYLEQVFPQIKSEFTILEMAEHELVVRLNVQQKHLRPGGTVSGPTMLAWQMWRYTWQY